MADAFAHSRSAYAGTLSPNRSQSFVRYACAIVLNLQENILLITCQPDRRRLAAGMAVNVCQAFLHDTKNCHFHIVWQSSEVLWNTKRELQTAAFRQALHVPPNCIRQAIF